MLSQDKCLPIAYKCLGFTVLFVLEKYCGGFKMVFIWHQEAINTSLSCSHPLPRKPGLPPGASAWGHRTPGFGQREGVLLAPRCFRVADAVRVRKRSSPVIPP